MKGNSLLSLPDNYTVVDIETTGFDARNNQIIEFGAVKVKDNQVTEIYSELVNPGQPINSFISKLTGITNQMLFNASPIYEVLPGFIEFISDDIVIGHNVNFDIGFINENSLRVMGVPFSNDFVDTMRLSRRLYPHERHHKLSDLINRFNVGSVVEHRAYADAHQTHHCYQYMKQYVLHNGIYLPNSRLTNRKVENRFVPEEVDVSSFAYEKIFVFTGTLRSMSRNKATQLVLNQGGQVSDTIDNNTHYLVIGSKNNYPDILKAKSTKHLKAEQLIANGIEIQIISEDDFMKLVTKEDNHD